MKSTPLGIALIVLVFSTLAFACNRGHAQTTQGEHLTEAGQARLQTHVEVILAEAPALGETVERTDAEWRDLLTDEQYDILREAGTERAFSGHLANNHELGTYHCAGCGAPLFVSDAKFESGTGWPSFFQSIEEGRVAEFSDLAYGRVRTEVRCPRCGGHLGHLFSDGPAPTGQRYCINSAALDFREAD
jgi:peptide-methionine (R)-S-oxide reductase